MDITYLTYTNLEVWHWHLDRVENVGVRVTP